MSNSAAQLQTLVTTPEVLPGGMRNRVINGQFDIWQRGNNHAPPSPGVPTADRWLLGASPDGGVWAGAADRIVFTLGQTDVPNDPFAYMAFSASITGSAGNAETSQLTQRIENVRLYAGSKTTISFWARHAGISPGDDGDILLSCSQRFGGGGSPNVEFSSEILELTDVWQKFVFVVDVPSILGKTIGTNSFLRIGFFTQAGASNALGLPTLPLFPETVHLCNVQW